MSSMAAVRVVLAVTQVCCASSCYKVRDVKRWLWWDTDCGGARAAAAFPGCPGLQTATFLASAPPCVDIKSTSPGLDLPDVATCKALGSDAPRPGQCVGASVADDHG